VEPIAPEILKTILQTMQNQSSNKAVFEKVLENCSRVGLLNFAHLFLPLGGLVTWLTA
jgi:hypothetical protein